MPLGTILAAARGGRSLTQPELAARMQPPVSVTTLSHWERGRRTPDADQLRELCRILHVSADVLLERRPFELGPMPEVQKESDL